MKILTLVTILAFSSLASAACTFNIKEITGCLRGGMYRVTNNYLKIEMKHKGYDLTTDKPDYSLTVIYSCFDSVIPNPSNRSQSGVFLTIKDNHSYFEETFFSQSIDIYADYQGLQNVAEQIPYCLN